jgi:hypothetical protein
VNVIVNVFSSSAVDREFDLLPSKQRLYKIDIGCFSSQQAALTCRSKYLLARTQNYCPSKATFLIVGCCSSKPTSKSNVFTLWQSWRNTYLLLTSNHPVIQIAINWQTDIFWYYIDALFIKERDFLNVLILYKRLYIADTLWDIKKYRYVWRHMRFPHPTDIQSLIS